MRHLCFSAYCIVLAALFFQPFRELAGLSLHNQLYSHFLLIPVVSLYFFIADRKTVFAETGYALKAGIALAAAGLLLYWVGQTQWAGLNRNDHLALMMFAFFLSLNAGFIGLYGTRAFRQALFPLLFLIFLIPIPTLILDGLTNFLLIGSAYFSNAIFHLLGVPVYRNGFVFELPGIAIEIARQCSGIRSTIGMFITSVVGGYMLLRTGWARTVLVLSIFPITVLKNAVRICTISVLAAYVDKSWVTNSWLHHSGGVVFFVLGLILLIPMIGILMRLEKKTTPTKKASGQRPAAKANAPAPD